MYNIRMDSLAAEREWRDMRIIGHLEANRRTLETSAMTTSTKKTPRKRKHARTTYSIGGIEVCRNTFQFLMGISLSSTLADIAKVVENSSPESHLNIPQLVGLEDGTVLVNTFDWQAHLSPYFPKAPTDQELSALQL
ncbi:hypothetical protein XENOCAPTIV_000460 [Xenoophorus captivus]|uniref:Uncharacterized protein n=1 Tax=Xenoophorus captivus TaxID=1517983 RepID=A0ABV0QPV2_9TELE